MAHKAKTAYIQGQTVTHEKREVSMLLVDPGDDLFGIASRYADKQVVLKVDHAKTITEARQRMTEKVYDLSIIELDLEDGVGLDFAEELAGGKDKMTVAVVTNHPSIDDAVVAIRMGLTDILMRPLEISDVNRCLQKLIEKQAKDKDQVIRVDRLRRLCKKLNQAREDVSQQVDVLCNDLVMAYQELANQMQQVVQTSEYSTIVKEELELESLLRKSLEYMIEKVGPANAAIFLPSGVDQYTLGGYVNYDCTEDSADMLLAHLADVVAPKIAMRDELLHITDNGSLDYWIGDDAAYLADSHVIAVPCLHEGETLCVFVLFRDQAEPFEDLMVETCSALGPLMAESLARVIRVHHRVAPELDAWDGDDNIDEWNVDMPYDDTYEEEGEGESPGDDWAM
ncbi:response regulator [Poriferisphaera sp. WC338]|uniref:response regulator n=1 Tax=Poriferisphaera sp. WC338 TaxID=3425129 RepID=UPI003D8170A6